MMLFSKIIASVVLSLLVYNSKSLTSCQEKKTKLTHQFGRSTQRAQISRVKIKSEEKKNKKHEHYMVKTTMALNRF